MRWKILHTVDNTFFFKNNLTLYNTSYILIPKVYLAWLLIFPSKTWKSKSLFFPYLTFINSHEMLIGYKAFVTLHCQRRRWHPTPVLLPGKSHGQRSLVGCSPWGRKESDTAEWLHFHFSLSCIGAGNGNPLQCSCLENPRTGEPGRLPSMGSHRVGHNRSDLAAATLHCNFTCLGAASGEGNGNPLQYFCLENPMGRGAW